jgi:hypothetical protein
MKAKLILKHRGDYDYFLVSRTDNSEALYASLNPDGEFEQKLSKQNCDEIFGVVDVELMSDFYGANAKGSVDFKLGSAQGFEDGFNKAMELNRDKVFTLEDMRTAMLNAIEMTDFQKEQFRKHNDYHIALDIIQSLQQPTEIEVEIEMEWVTTKTFCDTCNKVMYPEYRCEDKTCFNWQPKLDSEGCLILIKKI